MYQGAKHGILFRSSSAIDNLAQAEPARPNATY